MTCSLFHNKGFVLGLRIVLVVLVLLASGMGYWMWRVDHRLTSQVVVPGRPWYAKYVPQFYEPLTGLPANTCEQVRFIDTFDEPLNSRYWYTGDVRVIDGVLKQFPVNSKIKSGGGLRTTMLGTRGRVSGDFFVSVSVDGGQMGVPTQDQEYGLGLFMGENIQNMTVFRLEGASGFNPTTKNRRLSVYRLIANQVQDQKGFELANKGIKELGIYRQGESIIFLAYIDDIWMPLTTLADRSDTARMFGLMTYASTGVDGFGQFDRLQLECGL